MNIWNMVLARELIARRPPTTNLVTSSDRYWLLVRRGWVLSLGGSIGVYPYTFNFYKRGGIVLGSGILGTVYFKKYKKKDYKKDSYCI